MGRITAHGWTFGTRPPMESLDAVRMAFATLAAQKLKTFFSLLGVLIGVTFLIAVVSIVQGMNAYVEDQVANQLVGLNTFQVVRQPRLNTGNIDDETRREWARRPALSSDETRYLETTLRTPALFARVCGLRLPVTAGGKTARDIELYAADPDIFRIRRYDFDDGRPFTQQEARSGQLVVVLANDLAQGLFPDANPLGQIVGIDGLPYRVVGVVAKQGTIFGMSLDKFAVAPFESPLRRASCGAGTVDELHVQARDPRTMMAARDEAETLLRIRRRLRPEQPNNFEFQTAEAALAEWRSISAILFTALPGLVAISLVVGGIVIMNIMLMAVAERTREIGIRKAVGAKRRDIMAQFVVESITISVSGAAFGVLVGLGLAYLIAALSPLPAAVAPWSIGLAVGLGMVVGFVAGVYPASRAARLDPITALRAE